MPSKSIRTSPTKERPKEVSKEERLNEHVVSKQRVADHGEVLTPPKLVNDMLNLPGVADECERLDARFLEPACGTGNFLAEVLERRLAAVDRRNKRALIPWERDALLGLSNIYGIELLYDNVDQCRKRLTAIFEDVYRNRFKTKARTACVDAARFILRCNIHQGDALAMTTVGDKVYDARPLVFTEWSLIPGGRFKRRQFEYRELMPPDPAEKESSALFSQNKPEITSDQGNPVFIAQPIADLPLVHYLELGNCELPGNATP